MQQNAQAALLQTIDALIQESELDKAIEALLDLDEKTQAGLKTDILAVAGNYRNASKEYRVRQTIDFNEYSRHAARARVALLDLMQTLPKRLQINAQLRDVGTYQFEVPDNARLEKIIGDRSSLLKISWLEKAMNASKAVCRVVCGDELGTGFITKDGYLFTNNHVIKDAAAAAKTRIEFNYQMDANGQIRQRSVYQLDASDFIASPPNQFDFVRVKVVDNPSEPLSKWGYVEIDPNAIPVLNEPATIIQHPKGEDKQIALNANEVLSVWNQYLFYTTDTEPGSSGSPVFNKDWKVVAIHHAGKTLAEGGLTINAAGERAGANRGILFGPILDFIKNQGGKITGAANISGAESVKTESPAAPSPQPPMRPPTTTTPPANPAQPHAGGVTTPTEPTQPEPPAPNTIPRFTLLYDLQDEPAAALLNKHLTVLKITKKIMVYNVHQVKAGEDLLQAAENAIQEADYILVLISSHIFNEDGLWLGYALGALEQGKKIIPIKVNHADLEGTGLERLRGLPSMNRSVSDFPNPDAAWKEVVEEIKRLIKP